VLCLKLTEDRDQTLGALAAETHTGQSELLDSPYVLVGSRQQVCDEMTRIRDRLGISYFVFDNTSVEDALSVVPAVAGQ